MVITSGFEPEEQSSILWRASDGDSSLTGKMIPCEGIEKGSRPSVTPSSPPPMDKRLRYERSNSGSTPLERSIHGYSIKVLCRSPKPLIKVRILLPVQRCMAERRGRALQKLTHQFESGYSVYKGWEITLSLSYFYHLYSISKYMHHK